MNEIPPLARHAAQFARFAQVHAGTPKSAPPKPRQKHSAATRRWCVTLWNEGEPATIIAEITGVPANTVRHFVEEARANGNRVREDKRGRR